MANRPSRPRARLNISRAATLPTVLNDMHTPSIEDSLQDWFSQSITESPIAPLLDTSCPCCDRPDCEPFDRLTNAVRKLEGDARLAAEIGQSLLHKHETHVLECAQVQSTLEEQLDEAREKVRQLEQLLVDADAARQELEKQKSKTNWEWQKTQKTLQETAADLEAANARCAQLANELRANTMEVDRLRIFKFMVRQADIREETLRAKLEDTKQELAISRKTALTLESKNKKLKTRHESVCSAYEKLKLDYQEMGLTSDKQIDLAWLKESNERLRNEMIKLTSALMPASFTDMSEASQNQQMHLITLIKELVSANNKLKNDLLDYRDLLSESRSEMAVLQSRIEKTERGLEEDDSLPSDREKSSPRNEFLLSSSAPQSQDNATKPAADPGRRRILAIAQRGHSITASTSETPRLKEIGKPSPTSSTSMPTSTQPDPSEVVHHHFHYYVRQKTMADNQANSEKTGIITEDPAETKDETPKLESSFSLSTQASSTGDHVGSADHDDGASPYQLLRNHIVQTLQRLRATDIRALNRRLQRAFDITELSAMSNSIIENILTDVKALKTRFLWIDNRSQDESLFEFFPLVQVVQDILMEIGQLRTTMNDLQLEYVKKVEESDVRAEAEALRKHESRQAHKEQLPASGALAWLSNMFQRASAPSDELQKGLVRSASHESLVAYTADGRSTEKPAPPHKTIRHRRSDIDRHGPSSSLPRTGSSNEKRSRQNPTHPTMSTSSTTSQPRPIPYPALRASRSAGGSVRRSKSIQAPALDCAAVARKKSITLGLAVPIGDNDPSASPDIDVDWKVGSTFGATSWLGNK